MIKLTRLNPVFGDNIGKQDICKQFFVGWPCFDKEHRKYNKVEKIL